MPSDKESQSIASDEGGNLWWQLIIYMQGTFYLYVPSANCRFSQQISHKIEVKTQ